MQTILEIQTALQKALTEANEAQSKYDKAHAALEPLKDVASDKQREVNTLIREFQRMTGMGTGFTQRPGRGGRRGGVLGPRKQYQISDASKLAAASKRAITRALKKNPGLTEAEKKKIGKDAEKSLAARLAPGQRMTA